MTNNRPLITIFNGRGRSLGGSENDDESAIWAQIDVEFRDIIHRFKGARLAVFLAIALHADRDGWAKPGYDLLSKETGYSKRVIRLALGDLCKLAIRGHRVLLRYQEPAGAGKRFESNRYLLFPSSRQVAKYDGAGIRHIGDTGNGFGSNSRGDETLPRENDGSRGDETLPRYGGNETSPRSITIVEQIYIPDEQQEHAEREPEHDQAAVDLWTATVQDLRGQFDAATWSTWLVPTSALALDGDTLTVAAPNDQAVDWLSNRLSSTIARTIAAIHDEPLRVIFTTNGGAI